MVRSRPPSSPTDPQALETLPRTGAGAGSAALAATGPGAVAAGGQTISADEFTQEANARCEASQTELDTVADAIFGESDTLTEVPSAEDLREYVDGSADSFSDLLDDLEALDPPADLENDVDELIAEWRRAVAGIRDLKERPEALLSEDTPDPAAVFNRLANALGLREGGDESTGADNE